MTTTDWLLPAHERGNDETVLDRRHPHGEAWTSGNEVRVLMHGASYFAALVEEVRVMRAGDLLLFTDWRGDPDQRLDDDGLEIGSLLCEAASSGVAVRGLVWRSHLDRLAFSEAENRRLGEEINATGGVCLLDMRVRPGGSHHQKFVVLRHPGRPERDCAFVGGIDLCHSRRDDAGHAGDPQRQPMAAVYGPRPPWHDVQLQLRGPAVGDVEAVFRERWDDPAPCSRNPLHLLRDRWQGADSKERRLPEQLPDPARRGTKTVQLLRTYPPRRPGYPFAPNGERSVARGITRALRRARRMIYVEDQYLWSREIAGGFCQALETEPQLLLIVVLPRYPDQDGRLSTAPNLVGRFDAMRMLHQAGGDRVSVFGLENQAGTPIYVHAKVCTIDDRWASVGSDNFNRRSWTHDSELACAVVDDPNGQEPADGRSWALSLRLALAREHLGRAEGDDEDLEDPEKALAAFRTAATRLDDWHLGGAAGPRPPGQLRAYPTPQLPRFTRTWSRALYRAVYDPDGRRRGERTAF